MRTRISDLLSNTGARLCLVLVMLPGWGSWLPAQPVAPAPTAPPGIASMTFEQIRAKWGKLPLEQIRKAAEDGDPAAQFYVAIREFNHADATRSESFQWSMKATGGTTDSPTAEAVKAKWGSASQSEVQRAATAGDHEAQQLVALRLGEQAGADEQRGMAWLKRAAQSPLLVAQTELAWNCLKGLRSASRDPAQARTLFLAAAQAGYEGAQHCLADMLIEGDGIPCDLAEGIEWLRQAAAEHCSKAKFDLALQYSCGNGDPRNPGETPVALFTKAAQAGMPEAQVALAGRYQIGLGVNKDIVQAIFWYSLAAKQGRDAAAAERDRLKPLLTEADEQRVRELIDQFRPQQE
jgi:TPR repeat protein